MSVIMAVMVLPFDFFKSNLLVRTVELSEEKIDNQAVLNSFDDVAIKVDGSLTSFTGYQCLDASLLDDLDEINASYSDNDDTCRIKYDIQYDSESNTVIISAKLEESDGTTYIDNVEGICFLDDSGDINAVLNVDNDGILLSEMRDSSAIQNCGWFSKLIKKVATVGAVAAATVAVVTIVVATAGVAAPAVVGVGVAAVSASSAALTIASTSLIVATISAGVALTADIINKAYPGAGATISKSGEKQIIIASYNDQTKEAIRDITMANKKSNPRDPKVFFKVTRYNANGPLKVSLEPYTKEIMAANMRLNSWSSITASSNDAYDVIVSAFAGCGIVHDAVGVHHYHALDANKNHKKGNDEKYVVHSYYTGLVC